MGSNLKAMWTNKDIRNRILFTLFAFLVYRLGCAITIPDVNTTDLVAGLGDNSLFAMLNLLGGGGLEQFSVFALGVTPYITASIIIQLLSMDVIPSLTELSKSGANGRKKLDKYTRYLAVVFAFVQSFSLVYGFFTYVYWVDRRWSHCRETSIYRDDLYGRHNVLSLDWRSNFTKGNWKWDIDGHYGWYRWTDAAAI